MVAGGQGRVGGDQPCNPFGVFGGQPKPDQSAPVLPHEGHRAQIHDVEHQLTQPFHVPRVAVVLDRSGLVGAAESNQVPAARPP